MRDTASIAAGGGYNKENMQRRFMNFLSLSRVPDRAFISATERAHWDISEKREKPKEAPPVEKPVSQEPATPLTVQQQLHEQQAMLFRQHQEARKPSNNDAAAEAEPTPSSQPPPPSSAVATELHPVLISVDKASFSSLLTMTKRAASPFWMQMHSSAITSGVTFEVNDFRVNIGAWKQVQPSFKNRGAIIEIEYHGFFSPGADGEARDISEADWAVGEELIREFWDGLGIYGAREFSRKRDDNQESEGKRAGETDAAGLWLARLYIDALSAGNL